MLDLILLVCLFFFYNPNGMLKCLARTRSFELTVSQSIQRKSRRRLEDSVSRKADLPWNTRLLFNDIKSPGTILYSIWLAGPLRILPYLRYASYNSTVFSGGKYKKGSRTASQKLSWLNLPLLSNLQQRRLSCVRIK